MSPEPEPGRRRTDACGGWSTLTLAVAAVLALAAGPATAQQGWRIECSNDGKALDCRTTQQAMHADGRQVVALAVVRYPPGSKSPSMMIQLPLGLSLGDGVSLRVDDGPPEQLPLQTCTNTGCYAGLALSDKMLAALRGGRQLRLSYRDANKKPLETQLNLLGFGLALDRLK